MSTAILIMSSATVKQNQFYSYKEYSDWLDEIIRLLIDKGLGMEINTGGYAAGLGHRTRTKIS